MVRAFAIREAWQRVRVDLRVLWDDAADRLHEALDSSLDQRDLNRFTKRARILAAAIHNREPNPCGGGPDAIRRNQGHDRSPGRSR